MLYEVITILDRMSTQMGLIRTVYLRTIAVTPADVTPTLSLGLSMDHVVSILCAYAGGIVWTVAGPQWLFYLAAALSLVNLWVAIRVKLPEGNRITSYNVCYTKLLRGHLLDLFDAPEE